MSGSLGQTDNWFKDPTNQNSSAHYGISLAGVVHQYVQLQDGAWGNGIVQAGHTWKGPAGINPNYLTVSIETEDLGNPNQIVTDAQYNAVLSICQLVMSKYPTISILATHRSISPIDRPNCPGARWLASGRFQNLANQLGLEALL